MGGVHTSTTIELDAPIEIVWEQLSQLGCWLTDAEANGGTPWAVRAQSWDLWGGRLQHRWPLRPFGELTATSATTEARSPDRLTWELEGELCGRIGVELDDLDDVTFVRFAWDVRPSAAARVLLGPLAPRRLAGIHERAVRHLAAELAHKLGCRSVRTRVAGEASRPVQVASLA